MVDPGDEIVKSCLILLLFFFFPSSTFSLSDDYPGPVDLVSGPIWFSAFSVEWWLFWSGLIQWPLPSPLWAVTVLVGLIQCLSTVHSFGRRQFWKEEDVLSSRKDAMQHSPPIMQLEKITAVSTLPEKKMKAHLLANWERIDQFAFSGLIYMLFQDLAN